MTKAVPLTNAHALTVHGAQADVSQSGYFGLFIWRLPTINFFQFDIVLFGIYRYNQLKIEAYQKTY